MKRFVTLLAVVGIFMVFGVRTRAAEDAVSSPGKVLVEENCGNCHNAALYGPDYRKVADLDGLRKRVSACADGANIGWNDAQKAAVVTYLNKEYYKFD